MNVRHPLVLSAALLALGCVSAAPGVQARDRDSDAAAERAPTSAGMAWDQLTPDQQRALEPYRGRWNQLPPERQQAFVRGAERWQHMTPQQQEQARQRFRQWQELPPDERQKARKRYEQFRELPPDEQERLARGVSQVQLAAARAARATARALAGHDAGAARQNERALEGCDPRAAQEDERTGAGKARARRVLSPAPSPA